MRSKLLESTIIPSTHVPSNGHDALDNLFGGSYFIEHVIHRGYPYYPVYDIHGKRVAFFTDANEAFGEAERLGFTLVWMQ